MNETRTLVLSIDDVNVVLLGLGELKYKIARGPATRIMQQLREQDLAPEAGGIGHDTGHNTTGLSTPPARPTVLEGGKGKI